MKITLIQVTVADLTKTMKNGGVCYIINLQREIL